MDREACGKILEHHGIETEERQTIEEMAELTKVLNKKWRMEKGYIKKEVTRYDIVEEIADVQICLEELIQAYDCREEVEEAVDYKIKRTLKRIGVSE